jgi:excisionase family DNA binding protein
MAKLFYSTSEVANLFRMNRVTIYRWAKEGKVKAYGIGKHLKIPLSEVERLLEEFGFADIVPENGSNDPRREKMTGAIPRVKKGVQRKLVVAVDDDKQVVELIRGVCNRKKLHDACRLEIFSDSLEAAMRIGREKPDVILLNAAMPGCNGFGLAAKAERINKNVRIVVMIPDPDDTQIDCAGGVKVFRCLAKPIVSEELYNTIIAALH